MAQWIQDPANSEQHPTTYAQAVLLQGMMENIMQVYWEAHQAVVGAADGNKQPGSIQKSRTAMAGGRIIKDGVATINRQTQCALKQLRRGKVLLYDQHCRGLL